jgi:PAS domain S-box-containing protein
VGDPGSDGYLRRILVRTSSDGAVEELIITYESGPRAPRAELAAVRRRLANALEAIPDPVAYFDVEDRLAMCNTAYAELHSGPRSAPVVPGMRFEEILQEDLANGALEMPKEAQAEWLRERLRKHRDPVFETEIRTRDGRWFRVLDRATSDGDRVHVMIDITSLKIAQRRLGEVEVSSKVGLWSLDLATGAGYVNSNWAEMFGHDHDAMNRIGFEGWRAFVHPDDLAKAVSGFENCIAGAADRFEVEYRMRHKDGHWVWVLGRGGVAERDQAGQPRQMAGVLIDISRRKALETELSLRAAAVQASVDAIMITDASGSIIDANPALLRLFLAKNPEDVLGHPWYRLYTRSAAADLAKEAFPVIRSCQYWQGEAIAQRLDGSQFEQAITMTEMPDGRIVHVSRDVSAARALEREQQVLREQVELAQRQEVINLLAAGLTHDFSNLLALISHLSDPDHESTFDNLDTKAEIHRASRQMIELLNPLRGHARGVDVPVDADLTEIVRNAASLTALGAPHYLSVEKDLPDHPIQALVDPVRLTQVLLNLGLNARDAIGHEEGTIRFAMFRATSVPDDMMLDVGRIPDAPFAHLVVSDTGPGIPEGIRQKVWDAYFTTKGAQGTGLGLALVAQIINDVGGGIALDTSSGRGTTFHILWPLNQAEVVTEVAAGTKPAGRDHQSSVLRLSDSHILVDFLAHIPCELSTVLDGLEIGPA